MPKTTKSGKPKKSELPGPLQRSSQKAQRTWAKAHDGAVDSYGEGERAHRAAFSALKHSFKKKGDRWVAKDGKGPSDPRAKKGQQQARKGKGETFGGVDYEGSSKGELYDEAKKLDIEGRSSMNKKQLARAISRKS